MYVKNDLDSNTIGIILCPEANGFVCKTTLINTKNIAKQIKEIKTILYLYKTNFIYIIRYQNCGQWYI